MQFILEGDVAMCLSFRLLFALLPSLLCVVYQTSDVLCIKSLLCYVSNESAETIPVSPSRITSPRMHLASPFLLQFFV